MTNSIVIKHMSVQFVVWLMIASGAHAQHEPLPVATMVLESTHVFIQEHVYVGRIEARRRSSIGFEVSGMIQSVLADEGETVDAGEMVAFIDTDRVDARLAEQRALVRQANADFELATITLTRLERLVDDGDVTLQQVDEARERRNAAEAAWQRAQAGVEVIEVERDKSMLSAPYDATVIRRMKDEGDVVAAGEPVLELMERNALEARIGLPLIHSNALSIGDRIPIQVHGAIGSATVVRALPLRDRMTRTTDFILHLDDTPQAVAGDLIQATVETPLEEDGFIVPLTALTEGTRGLWSVYVVSPHDDFAIVERRIVDVIAHNQSDAFIRGSISDGEIIISSGLQRVVPGQRVSKILDQ